MASRIGVAKPSPMASSMYRALFQSACRAGPAPEGRAGARGGGTRTGGQRQPYGVGRVRGGGGEGGGGRLAEEHGGQGGQCGEGHRDREAEEAMGDETEPHQFYRLVR